MSLKISEIFAIQKGQSISLPLYTSKISAGFPSPADDFVDRKLDLNEHLIAHPAATFFVRVEGESMKDAGIFSNDLLIVDRSLEPKDQSVVVALLNGEFTVKRILKREGKLFLFPENQDYSPIQISEEMDFEVWGVVTHVIHAVQ